MHTLETGQFNRHTWPHTQLVCRPPAATLLLYNSPAVRREKYTKWCAASGGWRGRATERPVVAAGCQPWCWQAVRQPTPRPLTCQRGPAPTGFQPLPCARHPRRRQAARPTTCAGLAGPAMGWLAGQMAVALASSSTTRRQASREGRPVSVSLCLSLSVSLHLCPRELHLFPRELLCVGVRQAAGQPGSGQLARAARAAIRA